MKINFFNTSSGLFPFRWLIVIAISLFTALITMDVTGYRLFSGGNQRSWSANGPGYHK